MAAGVGAVRNFPTYAAAVSALQSAGARFHSQQGTATHLWWASGAGVWYRLTRAGAGFRVEPIATGKGCGC